jgi:hypothetical protein
VRQHQIFAVSPVDYPRDKIDGALCLRVVRKSQIKLFLLLKRRRAENARNLEGQLRRLEKVFKDLHASFGTFL